MENITIVIYTYNEEKNILKCISSAKQLTQNIVLIDMESKDKTREIALKNGVLVYTYPYSFYVEPARGFGILKSNTDWVLILDADEEISQSLAQEIKTVINKEDYTFYKIPRKNIFGKKQWLSHGGWYPDYQIRLINRNAFQMWPNEIHSTPIIRGKGSFLNSSIKHYFHGNFEKMVEKTIIFENIEAELLNKAHRNVSIITFFRKFLGELSRRLISRLGFLDRTLGIMESIYQAYSKTITYIYLYEKKKNRIVRPIS